MPLLPVTPVLSKSDMFLAVEGTRSGKIKGESKDDQKRTEIDIISWSWGMKAQTDMGGGGTTTKASMRELVVTKLVDSATTPLLSAMRNNELIKRATLVVRKSGKVPLDYFKITIEQGRITNYDLESVLDQDKPFLVERLSFSFQKINVEYVPQGEDGAPRGAMQFETETL